MILVLILVLMFFVILLPLLLLFLILLLTSPSSTLVRNTLQAPATPPSFALTESAHPVPVARYSSAVYSAAEMGEISVIRRSTSVPELTEVAGLDLPSRPPPRKKVAAAAQSSMPLLAPAGMLKSFMAADDPRLTPALRERMMDVLERSRWALWKKQQLEVRSFMRKVRIMC